VRRRRRQQLQSDEPQINLTPLIDVVFSILIMFILLAPLLHVDHVELAEESRSSDHASFNGSITLHVRKDNTVLLNRRPVALAELTALLQREKERHPHASPQIFHDKMACFGTYQSIKQAVEAAGFEKMDVILQPAGSLSYAAG